MEITRNYYKPVQPYFNGNLGDKTTKLIVDNGITLLGDIIEHANSCGQRADNALLEAAKNRTLGIITALSDFAGKLHKNTIVEIDTIRGEKNSIHEAKMRSIFTFKNHKYSVSEDYSDFCPYDIKLLDYFDGKVLPHLKDIDPRKIDNDLLNTMISDLEVCVNKNPELSSHNDSLAYIDNYSREIGETRGLSSELKPKVVEAITKRRQDLREAARLEKQRRDNVQSNNRLLAQYRRELESRIDLH